METTCSECALQGVRGPIEAFQTHTTSESSNPKPATLNRDGFKKQALPFRARLIASPCGKRGRTTSSGNGPHLIVSLNRGPSYRSRNTHYWDPRKENPNFWGKKHMSTLLIQESASHCEAPRLDPTLTSNCSQPVPLKGEVIRGSSGIPCFWESASSNLDPPFPESETLSEDVHYLSILHTLGVQVDLKPQKPPPKTETRQTQCRLDSSRNHPYLDLKPKQYTGQFPTKHRTRGHYPTCFEGPKPN